LAFAAVLVGIEAALELFGQRPLASNLARPGSLLGNASDEGAWAVLVLGPLAAVAATTRRWRYVVGTIGAGVSLVASGSRGALLGALVVGVVWFALEPRRSIKIAILGGLLVLALGSFTAPATRDRVVASSPYSRETVKGRELLWIETVHLVEAHLAIGVGAGGYVNAIPEYHDLQWQLDIGPENPPDSPHDWLLQAAANGGLPLALDAIALGLMVLVRGLASTREQPTRGERAAIVGMLAGTSGYGVALLFHFTSPGTTPLAAMFAGVLVARSGRARGDPASAPSSKRLGSLVSASVRGTGNAASIVTFGALGVVLMLAAVAEVPLRAAVSDAASGQLVAANHEFHLAEWMRPWDSSIAATAGHAFAVLATYRERGAVEEAVPWVATEVRDDPDGVTSLQDAAAVDESSGRLDAAIDALRHAVEVDPTNPGVLLELGEADLQKGLRSSAEAVLEMASRYAPGDRAVQNALAGARR